jgi:hypothetical protein
MDKSFESILEICVTSILEEKMDKDDCLLLYPEYQEKLAPLLDAVIQLQSGKKLAASKAFRSTSEALLKHKISTLNIPYPVNSARTKSSPQQSLDIQDSSHRTPQVRDPRSLARYRRLTWLPAFAVIILAFIVLTTGVIGASASAIPGDVFYRVKRASEALQLRTARSELQEKQLHLAFSGRRLDEAEELFLLNREKDIPYILFEYTYHLDQISQYLSRNDQGAPPENVEFISQAVVVLLNQQQRLNSLLQQASNQTLPLVEEAVRKSSTGLLIAERILAQHPRLIGEILESSTLPGASVSPGSPAPMMQTPAFVAQATTTTTVNWIFNPTEISTRVGPDPLSWLTSTPDNPRIATIWPTIYPTLSDIATRLPTITTTPRPLLRPTRVRPTAVPTDLVIPTRPPGR